MPNSDLETSVEQLLARMTLSEKVGQMSQVSGPASEHEDLVRQGQVGSLLNVVGVEASNHYQRLAREESRLGIPLLLGRDVIHGFRTIFPIPLGQAAAWHPELVEAAAAAAAREAASQGIRWTFAPMVDIARDPRWGRIAEGGGEDPYLTAQLGKAMVRGFQGRDLADPERLAACAKHYVGYGAAEGGRDYNTTQIPERTLREVYLPPFQACVEAGVATLMSAFNEINGIPAAGHEGTLRRLLKREWGFDGFVVSDWGSVAEMVVHGFCADEREAAVAALRAGVDMEMVSSCYRQHLAALVEEGQVPMSWIDEAVRRILRLKFRLGLFENPYVEPAPASLLQAPKHLEIAHQLACESMVLLKNAGRVLPLSPDLRSIAVIGPLADRAADQMGCWVFDGRPEDVITPWSALQERLAGRIQLRFVPGLEDCRSACRKGFSEAVEAAQQADLVVLFLGEDAGLSGEAHCRAFLDLPGAQEELVEAVAAVGKPLVAVIMAGRPLTLGRVMEKVEALLLAWHPGTMGGPALVDLLVGKESPSGKLPATFPRTVGQIPLYYARKNTGRPPQGRERAAPMGTPLDPLDFTSTYLDVEPTPLFPFGYGLSYTEFQYRHLRLSTDRIGPEESLTVSVDLHNVGPLAAEEVVQLYVRDLVGSVTRPVKELRGFQRVRLQPGEVRTVSFAVSPEDLRFYNRDLEFVAEPGLFHLWVGGSSVEGLQGAFEVIA